MGKYEEKQLNYTKDIAHLEEKEHWWGKVFGIGLVSGILILTLAFILDGLYWEIILLPLFFMCFVIASISITMWLYFYLKFKSMKYKHRQLEKNIENAIQRESARDYEAAIKIWEKVGDIEEASRVRKLQAEMGSVKVAQKVVHGDTIVKDSVVNKANIGSYGDDKFTRLEKLTEMKEKGLIDDEEFKQMKKEILEK
tara:strand:- start:758 stop:1348 length:591 start_codon:yes stop_codon:yes gene_type:complete